MTTERVEADLKSGAAVAPGPVSAKGPAGSIDSGSFRARRIEAGRETEGSETLGDLPPGDYLWFENGVRVTWKPTAEVE